MLNNLIPYHVLIWLLFNGPLAAQISLTYTGNMGVLLESENHAVLVDGLHEFYQPAYQHPSPEMLRDLSTAGGNYPIPEIALVTHFHGDHFSAKLYGQLSATTVIGPAQVTDLLIPQNLPSIRTVPYTEHQIHHHSIGGISIQAFRMDHVNRARHQKVENIGYLIKLGGYSILHVGDTDWYQQMFEKLGAVLAVDLAILPVWMLLQDQSQLMIQKYLNAKYLVVTHLDPSSKPETIKEIRKKFPGALVLTQVGKAYTF